MPEAPAPDDTLAAQWKTIAGQANTLMGRPSSTIKPRDRAIGSTGRGALQAFGETDADVTAVATGGLKLGAVLGEGGMGVVHLATQTSVGREVAVKSVRPARRGPGPTLKLLQEAWTAGRLEHPNIIPIYDIAAEKDGTPLIVLKRIEGEAWAASLDDAQKIPDEDRQADPLHWHLQVLIQVCNAVHYAHDRNVIHLDLKPDNIMIGRHGEVYVVDWGIAMALEDDGLGRIPLAADCTEIIGTPHYMAPEMLAPQGGQLSARTDVYLLGSILYELLVGRPPHQGDTLMEVLHGVLMTTPPLPESAPPELAQICRRAMAPSAADRFASAEDLRRAIAAFLRHRDSLRLAERATEGLAELESALAHPTPSDASPQVLFAPVRFGFEQALASWADNEPARDGLRQAFEVMIEHELEHGDPQVAAALAAEHPQLPTSLVERVAVAVTQRREGIDALTELGRQNDPTIGQRTRVFVLGVMGLMWTLLPAAKYFMGDPQTENYAPYVLPASISLVFLGGLALWARESLSQTRINRVAVSSCALALAAHPIALLGGHWMGLDGLVVLINMNLLWSTLIGILALTFDRRLFIISAAYLATFLISAAMPEHLFLCLTASNLVFVLVTVVIWRPATFWRQPRD